MNRKDNWEWTISMVYERTYRCHTYRYVIRKNSRTVFNKDFFKYDEEKIQKIMDKLKRDESLKKVVEGQQSI